MALGLIGAALAGGGEAVKENATDRIKQMHDKAILDMRQKFQTSERVAGQEFTKGVNERNRTFRTDERIAGQDFTAGQNQLTRQQEMELARMREAGANSRAAASRNDWQMMTSSDGKPVRVNARTGDIEPMNVPEGMDFATDTWSDRDQAYVESLQAEMESLQEIAKTGMLSDEQQQRMQEIPQEMRTYAQDINADSEVLGAYEGMRGGGGNSSLPPESIRRPGLLNSAAGSGSSPEGGADNPREIIQQREQQEQQQQASQQQTAETKRLASAAKETATDLQNFRDYANTSMGGGSDEWTTQSRELREQGKQQMAELMSAYTSTDDDALRDLLMEGMDELRKAGVPLPQQ